MKWGDSWKYHVPDASTTSNWMNPDFDDTSWNTGNSGFGYGDEDDSTLLEEGTISVFLRIEFELDLVVNIERALLDLDFDDGFVAWLNGAEVARSNLGAAGSAVAFDQLADNDQHEARIYQGGQPDRFEIEQIQNLLGNGKNVLAIAVHNAGPTSSDLSAIPFLSLGYSSFNGTPQTHELLNLPATSLHTNFKLSKTGEYLGLYDSNGEVVDEIEFGPQKTDISWGRSGTKSC